MGKSTTRIGIVVGLLVVSLAAFASVALAAVTNETGTVATLNYDSVSIDGDATQYGVDGGIPEACRTVGSAVTFDIDLGAQNPQASNVKCLVPDSSAGILSDSGVPGKGLENAPGLQKGYNPKSKAAENAGKK